jgi:succinyl-CoA synthetase alpha subunit
MRAERFDVAVIFIPREAIIDAVEAGIPTVVALTEHIPAHDVLDIFASLRGIRRQRSRVSKIGAPHHQ